MNDGWIGVDLDGTLAEYSGWTGDPYAIGKPIPRMVERVQEWLNNNLQVWIFTARVAPQPWLPNNQEEIEKIRATIHVWCQIHIGRALPIVCCKNPAMIELWDDRCVQVIPNTGKRADGRE